MKKINFSTHVLDEMRYFDLNYRKYSSLSKKDLIWQVPEKIIFVDKYIDKNKSWSLLDIGCGPAENIKKNILPFLKKSDIYIGIDISKKLLERAKKNIPNGIFIHKPMGVLKFHPNEFDYISFFGSLHHDEFPEKTIGYVSKLLKYGGFLFLREPQEKAFKKGFGVSPHEGGIKPERLKEWLVHNDLKIIEWHYLNTIPFHFLRKILTKLRLSRWENYVFLWKIKVQLELFLEKRINNYLSCLMGTDMFIVAKKIK